MATPIILFANQAETTLAGSISAVAVTATLASGSGTLFPSPTGGQYFVLTFNDAATGLLTEIVHVTSRTGDVVTMVRAQEVTAAQTWSAGALVANLWTAGQAAALVQQGDGTVRIRLAANTSFFVSATGSDSNTGLSSGQAWRNLQHAWDVISSTYDLAGFQATIQISGNIGNSPMIASGLPVGGTLSVSNQAPFVLNFAAGSALQPTGSAAIVVTNGAVIALTGTGGISAANGSCVIATTGGVALIGGINFGACPNGAHVVAQNGGFINFIASYTISAGTSVGHYQALQSGSINVSNGVTCTLSGTPGFSSAFALCAASAGITAPSTGVTYSGGATGARYVIATNGTIGTNGGGANFFPGNSAGTTSTGGQYT